MRRARAEDDDGDEYKGERPERDAGKRAREMVDDDENEIEDDVINVEFAVKGPVENDYHGIKTLLAQLLPCEAIPLGDIADLVVTAGQCDLGNAIKIDQGSDDDLYGIQSLINMNASKHNAGVRTLRNWILRNCSNKDTRSKLDSLLSDDSAPVGWIVNERYLSIPLQMAHPLYTCLVEQIEDGIKEGDNINVKYYLYIGKTFEDESESGNKTQMFVFPEDSLFVRESVCHFQFAYHMKTSGLANVGALIEGDSNSSGRIVCLIPREKLPVIAAELESVK